VKDIIDKLKLSHAKFEDPHFGPTETDEYGVIAFYGNNGKPDPAGSKYPAPESLTWERPRYDDVTFETDGSVSKKMYNSDGQEEEGWENQQDDDDYGFSTIHEDVWCKHGQLFLDGSSSSDVIQVLN
jgi:hypothetical protein